MRLRNTSTSYGLIAQCLHWVTAVLIFVLVALGWFMHDLPADSAPQVEIKSWYYSLHKTIGISALALAITRIFWLIFQPKPAPLYPERHLENFAAQTVHWVLYGSILLLPVSGWLQHAASEGFSPIWWPMGQDLPFVPKNPDLVGLFGKVHYFAGLLIIGSVGLHMAGALKHLVIERDQTLARMWPGTKVDPVESEEPISTRNRLPFAVASLLIAIVVVGPVLFPGSQVASNSVNNNATRSAKTVSDSAWTVIREASSLEIEVTQSGNTVTGSFSDWIADIRFDPENLSDSGVEVEIVIKSLTLGNVTEQAQSPGILNAMLYPTARFVSGGFIQTGNEKYDVPGTLSVSGEERPALLSVDLRIEGDRAYVLGSAVISRLDFGIGAKTFPDEKTIGDKVVIRFSIEAEKIS